MQCIVLVEELLNSDSLLCVHIVDGVRLCRMQTSKIMMATASSTHTLLPNVAPNIMNMASLGWLEVGDVDSGVICDTSTGLGVGEGNEGGTENDGDIEGVGEDVGSGAEDEGDPEDGTKTDEENSSAVKL